MVGQFGTKTKNQNGQTWQACQRSTRVKKSQKETKMINLRVFDHLGPFWTHLDPFGPFQTKIDNFAPKHLRQTLLYPFGAKIEIAQLRHPVCLSIFTPTKVDVKKREETKFFLLR